MEYIFALLEIIVIAIIGYSAWKIGKIQAKIQDSVELYATYGKDGSKEIICIQNIGTRVVYFDSYNFNGKTYELNSQVRPSTYSNALNNFYWVQLPANGENYVSLYINFHDIENRKWKSKIVCDLKDSTWKIKTYPSELIKK